MSLASNPSFASASALTSVSLAWALIYANDRLPVFPVWPIVSDGRCRCELQHNAKECKQRGKHPITFNGHNAATIDPELIRKWFSVGEELNVGIAVPEGLLVVDVDPRSGGDASLVEVQNDPARRLADTRTSDTGGGGVHMLFKVPFGMRWPAKLTQGIDLKSVGGYIVAPPSLHSSGKHYAWRDYGAPIAEAPAWLLALGKPRDAVAAAPAAVFDDDGAEALPGGATAAIEALAPAFVEGVRHHVALALGGWLKGRGYSREAASSFVTELAARAGSKDPNGRARDALAAWKYEHAPGWGRLAELVSAEALAVLEREIPDQNAGKRRAEAEAIRAALPPARPTFARHTIPAAGAPSQTADLVHAGGALVPAVCGLADPLMVHAQGSVWLRRRDSNDYDFKVARADVLNAVKERFPEIRLRRVNKNGDEGSMLAREELLCEHSRLVRATEVRYTQSATYFDPQTSTLTRGLRCPIIAPRFDVRVENLLRAMVGADALPDMHDWIASCRQDRLDRPGAILALVGPPSVCKTFLSVVLANMQGSPRAVPLKKLTMQFQSELTECAVLVADEEMPKELTQAELSEIVPSNARFVEHKGVDEKARVIGCFRIVATANAIERLRLNGSAGPEAVRALADRFAVFIIPSDRKPTIMAAQNALKLSGDDRLDVAAFMAHFAWIQATVTPRPQRFLGARQDPSLAATAIARIDAAKHPEVFGAIQDYLEGGGVADRGYRLRPFEKEGDLRIKRQMAWESYPIFVHEQRVCVRSAALAVALGVDVGKVNEAVKPMKRERRVDVQILGDRVVGYALDTAALRAALPDLDPGWAAACALGQDTAVRRRLPANEAHRSAAFPVGI